MAMCFGQAKELTLVQSGISSTNMLSWRLPRVEFAQPFLNGANLPKVSFPNELRLSLHIQNSRRIPVMPGSCYEEFWV